MTKSYVLDLKVARRKSGLSQSDCAHLLGAFRTKVSRIERGETLPSITDLCVLSLVHGKPFETLFCTIFDEVRPELLKRVHTLPVKKANRADRFNRSATINMLAARLEALDNMDYDIA